MLLEISYTRLSNFGGIYSESISKLITGYLQLQYAQCVWWIHIFRGRCIFLLVLDTNMTIHIDLHSQTGKLMSMGQAL